MKRRFTNEQVIRILREMAESRNEPVKDLCKRLADGRAHDRAIRGPIEPKMPRLFLFLFNDLRFFGPRMARNASQKINFRGFAFLVVRPKRLASS